MIGSPASRGAVASTGCAGCFAAAPGVGTISAASAANVAMRGARDIAMVDCAVVDRCVRRRHGARPRASTRRLRTPVGSASRRHVPPCPRCRSAPRACASACRCRARRSPPSARRSATRCARRPASARVTPQRRPAASSASRDTPPGVAGPRARARRAGRSRARDCDWARARRRGSQLHQCAEGARELPACFVELGFRLRLAGVMPM